MMDTIAAVASEQAGVDQLCSQFLVPIAAIVRRANGTTLIDTPDLVLPSEIVDRAEFFNSIH